MTQAKFNIDFSSSPLRLNISDLRNLNDTTVYCRFETGRCAIDGVFKRVAESKKLIIMFPAALPVKDQDEKRFPALFRWSWVDHFDANVWCFEEAIARKYDLIAAWFQESDHFHADVIAEIVKDIANELKIDFKDITLVGSSLGGFGALMVAPAVPGCLAISDIGQTDLFAYQYQNHIRSFCEKIYGTTDVQAVNRRYRDRFSVVERFRALGQVPNIIILHELTDEPNGAQQVYGFLAALGEMRSQSGATFNLRAVVRCTGEGHKALHQHLLLRLLKSENRI